MIFYHGLKHFNDRLCHVGPLDFHGGDGRSAKLAQSGIVKAHDFDVLGDTVSQALGFLHGDKGQFVIAA